jgi:hypothetical protein
MKKFLVLVTLLLIAGCTPEKPSVINTLQPVNSEWKAKYGDSDDSRIVYNIALCRDVINQHAKIINNQNAALKMILAEPNEPNEAIWRK